MSNVKIFKNIRPCKKKSNCSETTQNKIETRTTRAATNTSFNKIDPCKKLKIVMKLLKIREKHLPPAKIIKKIQTFVKKVSTKSEADLFVPHTLYGRRATVPQNLVRCVADLVLIECKCLGLGWRTFSIWKHLPKMSVRSSGTDILETRQTHL